MSIEATFWLNPAGCESKSALKNQLNRIGNVSAISQVSERSITLKTLNWLAITILAGASAVGGSAESVARRVPNPAAESTKDLETYSVAGLKRVFFASAKSDLKTEDQAALRHVAETVRSRPESIVEVRAYTDCAEQDSELPMRRAGTVANFLAANGIPWENIRVIGLGAIEGGPANNQEHRRADLRVFVPSPEDPRLKQLEIPDDTQAFSR